MKRNFKWVNRRKSLHNELAPRVKTDNDIWRWGIQHGSGSNMDPTVQIWDVGMQVKDQFRNDS